MMPRSTGTDQERVALAYSSFHCTDGRVCLAGQHGAGPLMMRRKQRTFLGRATFEVASQLVRMLQVSRAAANNDPEMVLPGPTLGRSDLLLN